MRFTLDEEDHVSIADANSRVASAFDVEKVTKRFYDRFKTEHQAFLKLISGISDVAGREWYASLMLNRMMFIYFIQKRSFLDGDPDYLRNRLETVATTNGNGKFHSFYRMFLLRLFHEGLGKPEADRDPSLAQLIGEVPYLNGGLFDVHALESENPSIDIPDDAFKKIFDFFDAYRWHLDDRPLRNDNEINPDVLGFIFEKYVNQKQMGAYYTKEDITGYISRNTILPRLLDQAKEDCAISFAPKQGVWRLLAEEPDRYIYPSVRHGITLDMFEEGSDRELEEPRSLPLHIANGLNDSVRRDEWNKPALPEYALPTETWREHIARRQRYDELRRKLAAGEIFSVNDLITCNLDIEQFVEDAINYSEGPELVRAFWKAIRRISILDPTVGSGAFLFAALNVLEPLYNACLSAMRSLLEDLEHSKRSRQREKMSDFRKVLEEIAQHPSETYFVLKSIVINNLYGVDIMEEAVEICKLRLFLKLVAQLGTYEQIEPLPDIDFNIRTGNTLVGFISMDEVKEILGADLIREEFSLPQIVERAEVADIAFARFRNMQAERNLDARKFTEEKATLRQHLNELRSELDTYLAEAYGVQNNYSEEYHEWRYTHQPFHWFAEFYEIISHGGFDIVIGNPPYIASKKLAKTYDVRNLECKKSPDIYAWVLERSQQLLKAGGRTGMIVPLSLGFSKAYDQSRRHMLENYSHNWFAHFGRIPSALFNFDTRVRNTITLALKSDEVSAAYTTRLHRWFNKARGVLFEDLRYAEFQPALWKHFIPKVGNIALLSGFEQLLKGNKLTIEANLSRKQTEHVLHFKQTAYNWLNFCRHLPPCFDSQDNLIEHSKFGQLYFESADDCDLAMILANGKLMFLFWMALGDDFDVTRASLASFPLGLANLSEEIKLELLSNVKRLEEAMEKAVQFKLNAGKKVGNYNLALCREITDTTDKLFLDAMNLSDLWDEIELFYCQCVRTDFAFGAESAS